MRTGDYIPWSDRALRALACAVLTIAPIARATPMQYQEQLYYPAAAQTVFGMEQSLSAGQFSYSQWDFAQGPTPNATGHLVFDTVRSLLQHWPNTRYRNGHTIVLGTIPPGTLLYHGRGTPVIPTVPEWTATDPDHSYLFCRLPPLSSPPSPDPPDEGCWHLTLTATRNLRVLYFDGSSAAKLPEGPMDTQDLVAWGRIWEEKTYFDRERLEALCKWAEGKGVDGFVRMEFDFEVMLCDFTAGLEVVSFLHLNPVVRQRLPQFSGPGRSPSSNRALHVRPNLNPWVGPDTRVLEAGSWHNAYPGEARVALDYTRLISFYDATLFPGLAQARVGVPRLKHNLEGIDEKDTETFKRRLEALVKDRVQEGSGIDWLRLYQTIAERYAERLERLPYILNITDAHSNEEARNHSAVAYRTVGSMIAPYILHTVVPPTFSDLSDASSDSPAGDTSSEDPHAWAAPVWAQCAGAHTNALARPALAARMTASEKLLLSAAREVEREICRVLVGVWAEGRPLGFREWADQEWDEAIVDDGKVNYAALATDWRKRIEGLMRWLDWSVDWLRCRPACGIEEMCILPTWPFFSSLPPRNPPPNATVVLNLETEEPENEWEDPQPTCVRIIESLEGGYRKDKEV